MEKAAHVATPLLVGVMLAAGENTQPGRFGWTINSKSRIRLLNVLYSQPRPQDAGSSVFGEDDVQCHTCTVMGNISETD